MSHCTPLAYQGAVEASVPAGVTAAAAPVPACASSVNSKLRPTYSMPAPVSALGSVTSTSTAWIASLRSMIRPPAAASTSALSSAPSASPTM
jgi:hypothetical protein